MARDRVRIGVDLDGCVFDFDHGVRRTLRSWGYKVPLEESQAWDEYRELVGDHAWARVWGQGIRDVFGTLPAYPGSLDALRKIQGVADVFVITHRPNRVADITLFALAAGGIRPQAVVHCSNEPKSEWATYIGVAAFIEDRDKNVVDVASAIDGPVFMPRRGWNSSLHEEKDRPEGTDIRPFDDWEVVASWVKRAAR